MENNTTTSALDITDGYQVASEIVILRGSLAGIAVLINSISFVICFKALKKQFHTLLILALGVSDAFLGMASIWFSLSTMLSSFKGSFSHCLFTMFSLSFGLLSKSSFIFMLSLERYLTIRSFNFGMKQKFERNKIHLVMGTVVFALLVSSAALLTPHSNSVDQCRGSGLYGDFYQLFVLITVGTLTALIFLFLTTTLLSTYEIWKIFFRKGNKVHADQLRSSLGQAASPNAFVFKDTDTMTVNRNSQNIPEQLEERLPSPCATSDISISMTETSSINKKTRHSTIKKMFQVTFVKNQEIPVQPDVGQENSLDNIQPRLKGPGNSWEVNAFVTCVVLATTVLLLTGPFVASFWIGLLGGSIVPLETRFVLFAMCTVNSLIDPFIYAWRVPQVREQFKKCFRIA